MNENIDKNEQMREGLEVLKKKPRTAWDQRVYQTYEQLEHNPLDDAGDQIKFHNFQLTWKQIEEILTKEELEALRQWGMKMDYGSWPDQIRSKLPTLRSIIFNKFS